MTDFLQALLTMSVMGAVAIPVTMFLRILFGKWLSPKAQLSLWIPVLLRLFIPYVPKTPLSVYNLLPRETLTAISLPPVLPTSSPTEVHLLPGIWFLGFVCFAICSFVSYLRFVNQLEFVQKDLRTIHAVAEDAATLTVLKKQPQILFCRNRISPMVVGLFSPRLVLPIHITEQFDEEKLRIIFVHEYTHLVRRDGMLNWLLLLVGCLHWFNPLVHLMRKAIRKDAELVCDACVLKKLSIEACSLYSQTILELLESTVSSGHTAITAPMAGTKRSLAARLSSIYRLGKRKLSIIALPLCLMVSVFLLTGALATDISETVGTVSEILNPILVIPPAKPSPFPSEETPSEEAPSEDIPSDEMSSPMPAPSAEETSSSVAEQAESTSIPTSSPTPDVPTSTSTTSLPVYIYQGGGAVARLSKDRSRAGFSAQFDNVTITTEGIRSATEDSVSGFFTITVNGEVVCDHAPGIVRGSVSGITFSTSDGTYRYTFPLTSRTTE